MLKFSLLGGVAATALLAAAAAATPAAADEPFNWSGFYVGAHAGLGAANYDGGRELAGADPFDPPEFADNLNLSGLAGGFHVGFNHQFDSMPNGQSVVLGIEADLTFPDWNDTIVQFDGSDYEGISGDIDLLASIRARLGVERDHTLLYLTGGIAFTDASFSSFELPDNVGTVDFNDVGGVVGGGIEAMTRGRYSIRAEGLYYFFGESHSIDGLGGAEAGDFGKFVDAFVVRMGVSAILGNVSGGS